MSMPLEPIRPRPGLLAPEVWLEDITTIIDDSAILHRLRLYIPAGKVTVLMGPSGVGKTTLIKHVVGLLEPDGGTVRIGGQDIWESSPEEWQRIRKGFGAMLGGHNLYSTSVFSSMTVLENLTYSLQALGVPEDERHERAMARLRELHLDEVSDQLPERLPAHASKRLALARALVADAPLTVLDEIDVGLDREHTAAMLEAVRKLRDRTGCTLLVTTHTLELASSLADNLAILVNGRIVAAGPPSEVLDGVESTEDFDRRFEFSDFTGPPRLEDAEADADRQRPPAGRSYQLPVDPQMVWIALAAVVLIAVLFVTVKLLSGGWLSPF
jgi:phospholipid/cholesterol/gamma-HCH transport system ATP-binding protein